MKDGKWGGMMAPECAPQDASTWWLHEGNVVSRCAVEGHQHGVIVWSRMGDSRFDIDGTYLPQRNHQAVIGTFSPMKRLLIFFAICTVFTERGGAISTPISLASPLTRGDLAHPAGKEITQMILGQRFS